MISTKHKKICLGLNYIQHLLILASTVSGSDSISDFATLVRIPVGIGSSEVGLKICAITARIKKHKSIIK